MFELSRIIRKNIRTLEPYSSARTEFQGTAPILLDANENALGSLAGEGWHRYPDPLQRAVKARLAELKGVPEERTFVGNGSDESIDLLLRAFCEPGSSRILTLPPTYGMYKVSARINDVFVDEAPLTPAFELDPEAVHAALRPETRLIFICSPNNPTGNRFPTQQILQLADGFTGLVIVDEAYSDFAEDPSLLPEAIKLKNVVVLQTLSKAWGLASLRIGMAFADPEIIDILNRIKPPYNVGGPAQELALEALGRVEQKNVWVETLIDARNELARALPELACVEQVYPSETNYLLVRFRDAKLAYDALRREGVIVRDRSRQLHCERCLRITVGAPEENAEVLRVLAALPG